MTTDGQTELRLLNRKIRILFNRRAADSPPLHSARQIVVRHHNILHVISSCATTIFCTSDRRAPPQHSARQIVVRHHNILHVRSSCTYKINCNERAMVQLFPSSCVLLSTIDHHHHHRYTYTTYISIYIGHPQFRLTK